MQTNIYHVGTMGGSHITESCKFQGKFYDFSLDICLMVIQSFMTQRTWFGFMTPQEKNWSSGDHDSMYVIYFLFFHHQVSLICKLQFEHDEKFLSLMFTEYIGHASAWDLTTKDNSEVIQVYSESDFSKLDVEAIQNIFSSKNILVIPDATDATVAPEFNRELLKGIGGGSFYRPHDIHGQYRPKLFFPNAEHFIDFSVDTTYEDGYDARVVRGSLSALCDSAHDPSGQGKVLNCLSIPNTQEPTRNGKSPLDSGFRLWDSVRGLGYTGREYPFSELRWYLASTSGAYTDFHIDSNGTCTMVCPITGQKIWIIAETIPDLFKKACEGFVDGFDGVSLKADCYRFVAVALQPGMKL